MARLFIYGDFLDLVVPGQLSFDYYLGTTRHWRTSDEQYQWGGRDLRYNGSQLISGTLTFADYEYNGVRQWILDNASITPAQSVAYFNSNPGGVDFGSVSAVQLGWYDHAYAAVSTEPNSVIYGGNSNDKLNWVWTSNNISLDGQEGLTLCRLAEIKMFIHFQDLTETEV